MRYGTILLSLFLSIFTPLQVVAESADVPSPSEQEFILTAYYSPLPDQCCYVKGSYEADKILNGEGTHSADGTPVYAGMLAAPPLYPFGTRIVLPGLGVMTVHDRGGAIQEWDNAHRLDVWAGQGEEGLARALAFGVQHIRGTVYLPDAPMPDESLSLAALPAPLERLQPYSVAATKEMSTQTLQSALLTLGYFHHAVTGFYGDVTKAALAAFIADVGIDEPSDHVSEKTGVYLEAALNVWQAPSPVVFIGKESDAPDIRKMQRILRYLGYYRGRTDGVYSDRLFTAIFDYQKKVGLLGAVTSPGAGRIGPLTKAKLDLEVRRRRLTHRVEMYVLAEQASATQPLAL